ncbi:MAG: hypothetical protein M1828_001458 [Chrysothrix sp. TS-e1954]|nr:MAG: hypothetical protein M1828_001458 [Chrysothrix sp. TS-e1954]
MIRGFPILRPCLRGIHSRVPPSNAAIHSIRRDLSTFRCRPRKYWSWRLPPPPRHGGKALLAGSSLSPAAFVALGQEDIDDGKTGEQHMLAASRKEIDAADYDFLTRSSRFRRAIVYYIDTYLWEPLCTGCRFLHLMVIFLPVLATVPVIWLGRRDAGKDNERAGTIWWYGFLVRSMERAGAAFIKLGQWAASRTDIFPKEMCAVMSSLHSNAPAHSMKRTRRTVEHAFDGRPFDDIFEEFDEKPLGVGAIAQVYKARLKPDFAALGDTDIGDDQKTLSQRVKRNVDVLAKSTPQRVPSSYVAVKVLHPSVERNVRRDLRIMGFFAAVINAIPTMEWLSFPDEVAQFGEMMRLQLDLRIESANLIMFRKNFKDRTTAWFPFPYSEYTTREVLVEEFAQGIPLASFLEAGGGVFQKEIADEGLNAFLHMLLIDNFIHADLHPGNIMVRFLKSAQVAVPPSVDVFSRTRNLAETPSSSSSSSSDPSTTADDTHPTSSTPLDVTSSVLARLRPLRHDKAAWLRELTALDSAGYRPQLIFIDTGLVTELNSTNRSNFLALFKAVAEFDGYRAGQLMVSRCRQPDAVRDPEVFALRMQHLVLGVKSRTFALGNVRIGDILDEVLDMVRAHHVRLEGDFVNVVLSILLLEGIGRTLDPGLDLFAGALPILRQLGAREGREGLGVMLREGDFSMIKVWAGLEARNLIGVSVEEVERCVRYDQLSPNI